LLQVALDINRKMEKLTTSEPLVTTSEPPVTTSEPPVQRK
jgi:hypothetical protein